MEKTNNQVFLTKIFQKIKDGDFDKFLTLPFMTKELFFSTLKARILKKIVTGGTPILNDAEVKDCLQETKETAVNTLITFLKEGLIVRTVDGFEMTEKGNKMLNLTNINNKNES